MRNMFKRLLSLAIVLVMVVGMIPGNAFTAFAEETADLVISDLAGLIAFRDAVNAGDGFAGKTVVLAADIDMSGTDWSVNIGDDCSATFDGIFDGQGHTIKNLTAVETAQKSDVYICGGLFGAIYGDAQIKNLTMENVSIDTGAFIGNNVGVVVGFAYSVTGSIENVKVIGDINIKAEGVTGTGAIVGYDYYGKLTVKDCTVAGNEGSAITGRSYVGGVIGYASNNSVLSGNTVENVAVTATGAAAGGIAGIQLASGVATGNTVKNVALESQHENWKNAVGVITGTVVSANSNAYGNTFENVTVGGKTITNEIGCLHQEKPTEPIKAYVASVGTALYTSLEEAIAAANTGDVVTLEKSIDVAASIKITADKSITLDLNGNTITGTDNNTTGNFYLFDNVGTLTVKDSVGGGKITLKANNDRNTSNSSVVIANNPGGNLTIESGIIEHLGGTYMAFGIDNLTNGKGTYAETTINGGTIKSTYRAVRQFLNGVEAQNILTINGGTIEGVNKAVFFHDPSKNANSGTLTIGSGAEVNGDIYLYVTPGSTEWPVTVAIAEEALKTGEVLTGNVPEEYTISNNNGVIGIGYSVPTATVSRIYNEDLTFAMNFKADDVSAEQLAYYGDWYADFELTVNKDVTFYTGEGADGYLAGQYDAWSENWVKVPYNKAVTLKAGETVKIMAFAAELMGKTGLKYTYKEVYESVKDFDCGVYFTPEFLAANPDIQVTLELKIYNNKNEAESYTVGETYVFTIPERPTATVSRISNEDLTFAMNFKADEVTTEQLAYYGDWYADFVLTVNKDVTFYTGEGADGYLAGQYDAWSENWVKVPFNQAVTIKANESLKIMEFAAELMNKTGLKYTYKEVYESVKDFDCGVYFTPEFLAANPDIQVTLELRVYNNENESESYTVGETYVFTIPARPTATVSRIYNEDLTFAMNFKADEATEDQLYYYGDWYADFVLTVNKDVTFYTGEGADGYLAGQYDAWSENWVKVPFNQAVTIKANESLKIMEFAAELMNKTGLKYTYKEVYESVKDFDCGVYFTPEFLAANPDIKVTLELRVYNNENESESYTVGDTYIFAIPELPTATVTELENEELTFALNFVADEPTEDQLYYYGDWYADFELTVNKDVIFYTGDESDGYLAGQYDAWSENWVKVPYNKAVTLKAGETVKIMAFAAELMGKTGLKYTYKEVYEAVKDFDCGVFFSDEFLAANPDLEVTLELRMYNPENESESYVIGETYIFTLAKPVVKNVNTGKTYDSVMNAAVEAQAGDTLVMLKHHSEAHVLVPVNVDLDLDGYTLTASYASVFGNMVDNSEDNAGALVVDSAKFLIQTDNKQLTVKTDKGYQFVEIIGFNKAWMNKNTYVFQPLFEAAAHDMLKNGAAVTGVSIQVEVTWKPSEGSEDLDSRIFKYGANYVTQVINSYNPATGKYSLMYTLTLVNPENYVDLTCTAQVVSDTGVIYSA